MHRFSNFRGRNFHLTQRQVASDHLFGHKSSVRPWSYFVGNMAGKGGISDPHALPAAPSYITGDRRVAKGARRVG